jgi:hypothetical protein
MNQRLFPPPWSVEDIGAAFIVKDNARQKLGYFYCEDEPGWRLGRHRRPWHILLHRKRRRPVGGERLVKQSVLEIECQNSAGQVAVDF